MAKFRIVAFTAGDMTAITHAFFQRLVNDPLLDFAAVIVDEYRPPRKPLHRRIARAIAEDGWSWVVFKIASKVRAVCDGLALRLADWIHGAARMPAALPVHIHRVADIHSAESLALVRSLSPDLGIIVGTRILSDAVITIPTRGTLNIHKRKLPDYRGGGPVGYWEVLAGEPAIGISIHFATSQVDAGAVVADATIAIEECDTLDSVKLKADLRGAQLYHEAIHRVACGARGVPQDLSRGTTYRAPSEYKVWNLQRRLHKSLPRVSWIVRLRVLIQFVAMLPRLQQRRRDLIRERRAPIVIFFYHVVADRPLNHMRVSFVTFVRQMEFLRRYCALLSLDETVARLRSGENDQIAASITFDDGYHDNAWAIEYLRYVGIPATFFVSIGHVRDGSSFEHDLKKGYRDARPMSEIEVRQLAEDGFGVGSHGVYHEDFGSLTYDAAASALRDSREQIEATCGHAPDHFAFPKGQRGTNMTRTTFDLALKHYRFVFSAYGGYAFPRSGRRHFLRTSNPNDLFDLNLVMSGYNGFRQCLAGNAWGIETEKLDPCTTEEMLKVALIAASPRIVGGHSDQARTLTTNLQAAGHRVSWIPIDTRFPRGLRWLRRVPYARTVVNQALYLPALLRIARADVVHVFSASYWSFLLAPAPAIVVAKLMGKPVVLHYHSGEADDHLERWAKVVRPFLRLADHIVVPSTYLQGVFAAHGYRARVIPNCVDVARYRYRERAPLQPRLLSTRNLESHYRVDTTISAFARLKQQFPEATLTIVGSGTAERSLRVFAEKLRVDGIHFLGAVDPAAMPDIYDAADIFVNCSVIDNQPVSILEAFAAGLPIVSTATGDISAMLRDGEAGILVDADDPAAVADAVTRLLKESELSKRTVRRARQEVERYTWSRVGPQWNELYSDLLHYSGGEVLAHGA